MGRWIVADLRGAKVWFLCLEWAENVGLRGWHDAEMWFLVPYAVWK